MWGGGVFDATSCLAAWSHVPSRGVLVSGPMFLLGDLCPGGSLSRGVSVGGSLPRSVVSVQEWSLCPEVESLSRGTSVWGRVSVQGISVRGSLSRGGLCQRDPQQRPPRMVKGGRYASYWNAFLVLGGLSLHYITLDGWWIKRAFTP